MMDGNVAEHKGREGPGQIVGEVVGISFQRTVQHFGNKGVELALQINAFNKHLKKQS